MMRSIPRYGIGGSRADDRPSAVAQLFGEIINGKTHTGWIQDHRRVVLLGQHDPDGQRDRRDAQRPPGGRPDLAWLQPRPGFPPRRRANRDGGGHRLRPAGVWQYCADADGTRPVLSREEDGVELVASLIRTHFKLGGTQINLNIMDQKRCSKRTKIPASTRTWWCA